MKKKTKKSTQRQSNGKYKTQLSTNLSLECEKKLDPRCFIGEWYNEDMFLPCCNLLPTKEELKVSDEDRRMHDGRPIGLFRLDANVSSSGACMRTNVGSIHLSAEWLRCVLKEIDEFPKSERTLSDNPWENIEYPQEVNWLEKYTDDAKASATFIQECLHDRRKFEGIADDEAKRIVREMDEAWSEDCE